MLSPKHVWGACLIGAILLGAGTGCSNNKVRAERDALLYQNRDLEAQLKAEQARADEAARRAQSAEAAAMAAQNRPAAAPGVAAAPGTSIPAGEGVSIGTNKQGETQLEIATEVLFDSGKARLKPGARKALDRAAEIIKKQYAGRLLRIEGHTDPNPIRHSNWEDNFDLGAARANEVRRYLQSKGIPQKNVYIASWAANDPKDPKNYAKNRRVDIVVVNKR